MKNLGKELRRLRGLLARARTVRIVTHLSPDADGISACLALRLALVELGKTADVLVVDPIPGNCWFLPGCDRIVQSRSHLPPPDLIFSLDAGEPGLLAPAYDPEQDKTIPLVNVDHHLTNTLFGTVNLVDPEAGASCELLYTVIGRLGADITAEIATCLLAGLVSDTQAFRTANTTPHTLRVAADLMQRGAPLKTVVAEILESKPLAWFRLMGLVFADLRSMGPLVWAEVTPSMRLATGARPEDVDGIANLLSTVREAEVTVLFKVSDDGTVKVSVRTKGRVNAADLCMPFGGGGHARAAGCTLVGPSPAASKDRFLSAAKEALEKAGETVGAATERAARTGV